MGHPVDLLNQEVGAEATPQKDVTKSEIRENYSDLGKEKNIERNSLDSKMSKFQNKEVDNIPASDVNLEAVS